MSNKSMQAVLVNEYGGPNVLKIATVERPQPQADEVLIRIAYATVIPLDYKIRNGWLQNVFPVTLPYIPDFYASGVVEEIGQSVTEFKPGDRIFGSIRGAYAEYGIATIQELVKMPDNLTFHWVRIKSSIIQRQISKTSPRK
ncbi:hypothetical protein EHV15_07755 [Paenibacillus oralis]|uniref:Alcohol dehydrogenase-like N-terminal domain-containing protein n=1 Tax=Paenibacillus oralis TaxID=2490856 RepID=A0A3P3TXJ0_9BACL|nr:alcohol dehydrogenase catalytic domain-containing protein [Paenibacillus oralis]RRJ62841.1 hypothetical protein EHV15_07755 [Paenibacillus oralis]